MQFNFTLTPAYGRDYKSKAAVQADLDAGKDFLANGTGRPLPVNRAQLVGLGYTTVRVRYDRLHSVGVCNLTKE